MNEFFTSAGSGVHTHCVHTVEYRAKTNNDTDGLVKVLADKHTDRLLGPHIGELLKNKIFIFKYLLIENLFRFFLLCKRLGAHIIVFDDTDDLVKVLADKHTDRLLAAYHQ